MEPNILKAGDYVIVQRQGYTKLHKLKEKGNITLGPYTISLDNVVGHRHHDVFQMKVKNPGKKLYTVEKVTEVNTVAKLNVEKSGTDNRNITDDGTSQTLTKEEIEKLRDENSTASEMVEKLISNSKTFNSKTEYSQEKYMKKKEKKYFDYLKLRKPTIRLLMQMFYRQDPTKTLGIRIDDLSQILTYTNIQADGNFVLYDSGTSGLMTAALLNAIGCNTTGKLIHMHPGNECQKTAVLAMGFPKEQQERCINVNLYSVLRCYYQNKDDYNTNAEEKPSINVDESDRSEKNQVNDNVVEESTKSPVCDSRKRKNSETQTQEEVATENGEQAVKKQKTVENPTETAPKKPIWQYENEKACRILKEKVDGLVLTVKEHPVNIVKELIPFLKGSRSLVVFSMIREPLQDLFVYLKSRCDVISIRVSNNFMREYQILPERTHPEVNMTTGGYILSAYKLRN